VKKESDNCFKNGEHIHARQQSEMHKIDEALYVEEKNNQVEQITELNSFQEILILGFPDIGTEIAISKNRQRQKQKRLFRISV
jgi:hypothetical protein